MWLLCWVAISKWRKEWASAKAILLLRKKNLQLNIISNNCSSKLPTLQWNKNVIPYHPADGHSKFNFSLANNTLIHRVYVCNMLMDINNGIQFYQLWWLNEIHSFSSFVALGDLYKVYLNKPLLQARDDSNGSSFINKPQWSESIVTYHSNAILIHSLSGFYDTDSLASIIVEGKILKVLFNEHVLLSWWLK